MENPAGSLRAFWSRCAHFMHPGRSDDDFAAELESHIAMHTDDGIRSGLTPEEARRRALIRLGGIEQTRQTYRERQSLPWIEILIRDIRYGVRGLARNPGFTVVAVLTLSLGVGVTSTIFAVADAAFLRSWPAAQPERLVRIVANSPQGPDTYFSYPESQDLTTAGKSFEGVLAYSRHGSVLHTDSESKFLLNEIVSPNYFSLLGSDPKLASRFASAAKKHEQVVVISYSVWQRFFGADPQLVGKQISLTGSRYTVIGVAPRGFRGLMPFVAVDLWLPLTTWGGENDRATRDYELLGRLQPGVTATEAQAEIDTVARRLALHYPALNRGRTVSIISERQRLRDAAGPTLLMMAAVGIVMLICCANVAALILARSDKRRKEFAMRLAVGATRARLIRQLLTESLLLALASTASGLLLVVGLFRLQPALMPPSDAALGLDLHLDVTLVAFTVASSILAVIIFGFTPALWATRLNYASALKSGETDTDRCSRRVTLRNTLVVVEIALAATLLTASGLVLRSLLFSRSIDLGFDRERHFVFFDMSPHLVAGYAPASTAAFFAQVKSRSAALPGVKHVSLAQRVLLSDSEGGASKRVSIPGVQLPQGQPSIPVKFNAVDDNYFQAVGTRILAGRAFAATDSAKATNVAVISRNLANRFWPGGTAVGRQIVVDGKACIVVGVAEDAKINQPHEAMEPYLYLPFVQWPSNHASLIVDGGRDMQALIAAERSVFQSTDRNVPYEVRTIGYLMRQSFWMDQTLVGFVGTLGLLAIFLAAIGLYGVIAFVVNRRTREIGIRMALGAKRENIVRMVLWQGLILAGVGAGIGVAASLLTTRLLASVLYGVKPTDSLSLIASITFVVLAALAACWIPAGRAASVDPLQALHVE